MRILHVVPEFPVRTETFVSGPLNELVSRGHQVVVCARRPAAATLDADVDRAFGGTRRVVPARIDRRWPRTLRGAALAIRHGFRRPRPVVGSLDARRWGRHALSFALLEAAVPLLDAPEADVAHCHFGPAGVVGAMLAELGLVRAPLIVSFYGHDVTRYPRERGAEVYRRLFARAARVLALDPCMRDRLIALGADPARTIVHPLAVDTARFVPAASPPSRPPLRLLAIGRLVEKKGFDDALRACAGLQAHAVPARLRIAGDGPMRGELERLAHALGVADRVTFLGAVPHGDVRVLLAESHALIAPSRRASDGDEEGTPTVILEAMAMGLPVVATRHAGIPSQVDHGITGWLADEGDWRALAVLLGRLADPVEADRLGRAGRSKAEAEFQASMLVDRLERLYREIGGSRSAGP